MITGPLADTRILLVDDERQALDVAALALQLHGFKGVATCADSRQVADALTRDPASLVLLDLTMPHVDGRTLLQWIKQHDPDIVVVVLTGLNDARTAVECLRDGAYDYLVKPVDQARLVTTVVNALERQAIAAEAERLGCHLLDGALRNTAAFADIITSDERMLAIFRYVEAVAQTEMPVLVTGETGVGKELVAKAIHRSSGRSGQFVSVNTAGIDDTLFSDTLFGHVAGAFTGASRDRRGLVETASQGTLFLDEIGDLRPESQIKLLRLLQERTYYRLGSEAERVSSARIVAATNRDPNELQRDAGFRKDLFYRLKSHHIRVPPLRERPRDIPLLAEAFLAAAAGQQGKVRPTAPPELFTILANHAYPGNVRELQGLLFDAVSRHQGGVLSCASIKEAIGFGSDSVSGESAGEADITFPPLLPTAETLELALVREALRRTGGNKKLAAEMIGMARQTFRIKLAKIDRLVH
jgi:DNA-binding NtrC family response regulator